MQGHCQGATAAAAAAAADDSGAALCSSAAQRAGTGAWHTLITRPLPPPPADGHMIQPQPLPRWGCQSAQRQRSSTFCKGRRPLVTRRRPSRSCSACGCRGGGIVPVGLGLRHARAADDSHGLLVDVPAQGGPDDEDEALDKVQHLRSRRGRSVGAARLAGGGSARRHAVRGPVIALTSRATAHFLLLSYFSLARVYSTPNRPAWSDWFCSSRSLPPPAPPTSPPPALAALRVGGGCMRAAVLASAAGGETGDLTGKGT
jgi:hypothetical protein